MPSQLDQVLASLRDVQGVCGSFLVSFSGQMLARDLPALFDEPTLAVASARIARFGDAFDNGQSGLETSVLRFREHKVHLRRVPSGFLCVLSELRVNMPTLKMALALVGRRMVVEAAPPSSESTPRAEGTPRAESTPRAEPPGRRSVLYRGRRID